MKTNKQMIEDVMLEVQCHKQKQKAKRKTAVTVISVLSAFVCLTAFAGAAGRYAVFSPEWREKLSESVQNVTQAIGVEEFKEKLAASDDKFSKDEVYPVLMDYDRSIKIGVTQQGGAYTYTLDSIVPAQWLRKVIVGGSISDVANLQFEWQVTDAWFAVFEISRTDGTPMDEAIDPFFHWHRYVAGYNPYGMNMCLEGAGEYSVYEDGKKYTAVVITDMMIFADSDFVFAPVDIESVYASDNTCLYADADGNIELKDTAPDSVVLLRCKIPDSFADKAAQKEFQKDREYLDNFNGYEK